MSRIGKAPIPVPEGVQVDVKGTALTVTGPKGTLNHTVPESVEVLLDDGVLTVTRVNDERRSRALHGLTRSLVNNMVVGVSQGFRKDLEIVGVGYRVAANNPTQITLSLGFSHPVVVTAPGGITFEVPEPTKIGVIGIDKQAVGQVAATIRAWREPEPYKGKGVRYAGERVLRKAGKAGK
ncbi:MAG: 50S ribosomal protein L6 [Acidimicrobiia bacterium]|nr:50S ribosomal protein L6 [Acidimicrobiia bacterium]